MRLDKRIEKLAHLEIEIEKIEERISEKPRPRYYHALIDRLIERQREYKSLVGRYYIAERFK